MKLNKCLSVALLVLTVLFCGYALVGHAGGIAESGDLVIVGDDLSSITFEDNEECVVSGDKDIVVESRLVAGEGIAKSLDSLETGINEFLTAEGKTEIEMILDREYDSSEFDGVTIPLDEPDLVEVKDGVYKVPYGVHVVDIDEFDKQPATVQDYVSLEIDGDVTLYSQDLDKMVEYSPGEQRAQFSLEAEGLLLIDN